MFTGLIQQMGRVADVRRRGEGLCLSVAHDPWPTPLAVGESICVQGACLTVAQIEGVTFSCDVLRETLDRTHLGVLKPGAALNLERALRAGDLLGGHFVTGHVDGVGEVARLWSAGDDHVVAVSCGKEISSGIVMKGSVAVDGVSLTITAIQPSGFEFHLIPHTWTHTTLGSRSVGDQVNIETDVLGKYARQASKSDSSQSGLTLEHLRAAGFLPQG